MEQSLCVCMDEELVNSGWNEQGIGRIKNNLKVVAFRLSIILSLRVSATLTTSLLPLFHAFFFVGLVGFILLFGQYFF